MSIKFKIFLSILILLSLLPISSLNAQQVAEIRFAHPWGGERIAYIDAMLDDFNKTHPGIKVINQPMPGAYSEALQVAVFAGTGPDLFQNWGGEMAGVFIDANAVENLDRYYTKYNWYKILIPWLIKATMKNGKTWGVPHSSYGMSFWYRSDIWKNLGLKEPTTFTELESLNKKVKSQGIIPVAVGGILGFNLMRLVDYFFEVSCGPKLHDDLKALKVSWDRPEVVKAYSLLAEWTKNGWLPPGYPTMKAADAQMLMHQGLALMVFEGTWMEASIIADGFDPKKYDFFVHPTDHEPLRISAFPEQFQMASSCKNKDAAAEFLNWVIQPETQKKYYGTALQSTATRGVEPDPAKLPLTVKWRKILEEIKDTYPPADQALPPEVVDGYYEVQDAVAIGKITPEQAAKRMQVVITSFKAKKK